ncbi:MAG TPA: NAD(P)/FAD-dependent oxidoreductase, partial [Candidatus Deferrimicrobiaceae bacterium]
AGSGLRRMWDELGALDGREIVNNDVYLYAEDRDGNRLTFPTNIDALDAALRGLSPGDGPVIGEFIAACRKVRSFDMPVGKAPELTNGWDMLKFMVRFFPVLKTFGIWNRISIAQFSERFRHPLLRQAFRELFLPDFPMIFALMTIGWLDRKAAGYPMGGSLEFSRGIERRYLGLGGQVTYKVRVEKVLVENDRAVGVRLQDGAEHRADYVISAADGRATIFGMLEGRFVDRTIRSHYDNLPVFPSLVHMAFGVNRTFDDLPRCVSGTMLPLDPPVTVGKERCDRIWLQIYNFDPTLAPPGKTVVRAMLQADHAFWRTLKETPERYVAEKERIASDVIAALDKRFPGFAGQVEMKDVATPMTFERYTGNWKGSIEGWVPVPQAGGMRLQMSRSLPGLSNFYMAGQWVEPGGGVPIVALSGRNVVQLLCRDEKRKFVTTLP